MSACTPVETVHLRRARELAAIEFAASVLHDAGLGSLAVNLERVRDARLQSADEILHNPHVQQTFLLTCVVEGVPLPSTPEAIARAICDGSAIARCEEQAIALVTTQQLCELMVPIASDEHPVKSMFRDRVAA